LTRETNKTNRAAVLAANQRDSSRGENTINGQIKKVKITIKAHVNEDLNKTA
jgi:hypothetical protein